MRRAVAADEQDAQLDRRALVGAQAVDEQPLALLDAVLLAAETDDRVGAHGVETRAGRPRIGSVANDSCPTRRPTRTSVRSRSRRFPRATPPPRAARPRQQPRHRSVT